MKVAVASSQHSLIFGQCASSHTECRLASRMSRLSRRYFGPPGARTFSHGGLRSRTSITGSSVFVFKTESLCHAPQATARSHGLRAAGTVALPLRGARQRSTFVREGVHEGRSRSPSGRCADSDRAERPSLVATRSRPQP